MNRCVKAIALCTALMITASANAQDRRSARGATSVKATPVLAQSKNAAFDLLTKRVESVDWVEKTFEEIIEWLDDQSEGTVNIIPRWTALSAEGINNESFVTLKLRNTMVADILNETLEQLSEDSQLAYHGSGNNLRISTKGDFDRKLELRVYDATDILFRIPNFGEDAPTIDLQQAGKGGGGGGGGGGGSQSVFSGSSGGQGSRDDAGEQAEQRFLEQLQKLVTVIITVIEPASWGAVQGIPGSASTAAGTGPGRISIFNRSLIVYNTIEVHEQISGGFTYGKN